MTNTFTVLRELQIPDKWSTTQFQIRNPGIEKNIKDIKMHELGQWWAYFEVKAWWCFC
jgi:hypothetical protein